MATGIPNHPAAREQQIVARYLLIEDVQERLASVVERGRKLPPIHETQKTEEHLVPGCISRVWLIQAMENGTCHFRADADSTVVKGLVALMCEVYEGCAPDEVAGFETSVLEQLHLMDHLTPTRRNGIQNVIRRIRQVAGEM